MFGDEKEYKIRYIGNFIYDFITTDDKIKKSLKNNIYGPKIIEFILGELRETINWAVDYVNSTPNLTATKFDNTIIRIQSVIMDIYVLGRLFKNESRNQKNIIIYCGNYHAAKYKAFLNFIGITPIVSIEENPLTPILKFSKNNKTKSFLFN